MINKHTKTSSADFLSCIFCTPRLDLELHARKYIRAPTTRERRLQQSSGCGRLNTWQDGSGDSWSGAIQQAHHLQRPFGRFAKDTVHRRPYCRTTLPILKAKRRDRCARNLPSPNNFHLRTCPTPMVNRVRLLVRTLCILVTSLGYCRAGPTSSPMPGRHRF